MAQHKKPASSSGSNPRPPIVAILGHVDHGKTTLLDSIRKSKVAQGEAGNITQKIGAYQAVVKSKTGEKLITFLDTPGHEAFAKIRSRGATLADIAVLVVAADDGVKPQTEESIKYIKDAKIPFIVAINKMDLAQADSKKVQQQLAQHEVLVESLGGEVVVVELSAKTGKGIDQLLDMILLVAEMKGLPSTQGSPFSGVIVETRKDTKRGVLTTIVVKSGSLAVGDTLYAEGNKVKIRALFDDHGNSVREASTSIAVEVLGFKALPPVGIVVSEAPTAVVNAVVEVKPQKTLEELLLAQVDEEKLKIILKADSAGSLEAVIENLPEAVKFIKTGVGDISESEIMLGAESGAFVLGFNTKISSNVAKLAKEEGVRVKTYRIIYELLDEIGEVVEILEHPELQEDILGQATILEEFPYKDLRVAGCKVTSGRIVIGDTIRVVRNDTEVGTARIKSLKQGKNKVDKVEDGQECGIILDKKLDFAIEDSIIAYKKKHLL